MSANGTKVQLVGASSEGSDPRTVVGPCKPGQSPSHCYRSEYSAICTLCSCRKWQQNAGFATRSWDPIPSRPPAEPCTESQWSHSEDCGLVCERRIVVLRHAWLRRRLDACDEATTVSNSGIRGNGNTSVQPRVQLRPKWTYAWSWGYLKSPAIIGSNLELPPGFQAHLRMGWRGKDPKIVQKIEFFGVKWCGRFVF